MTSIDKELIRLKEISNGINPKKWERVYAWNTENLNAVFDNISINGKSIFSVLSSSDILFYLLINNAKKVDTFDINPLTKRYYYLRKWLLEYGYINAKKLDLKELESIINNHSSTKDEYEESSKIFWNTYTSNLQDKYRNIKHSIYFYKDPLFIVPNIYYKYPYSKEDISKLSKRINSSSLDFCKLDILSDFEIPNKKYDVVYLSNILDYANTQGVINVSSNIYNILNSDGYIICVNMFKESFINQKSIFYKKYIFEEITTDFIGKSESPIKYYIYRKR